MLGSYDYDEIFRIKISIPIWEIDMKDLPSPTAHSSNMNERSESELKFSLNESSPSKQLISSNLNAQLLGTYSSSTIKTDSDKIPDLSSKLMINFSTNSNHTSLSNRNSLSLSWK